MELKLQLKDTDELSIYDKKELDIFIDSAIKTHMDNGPQINILVFDSVTALTASEARARELSSQGFFKRIWGGITGSNQKLQNDIDKSLVKAQYSSQKILQKLSEQNLMSFELLTAVNNKLNNSLYEIDVEINKIYVKLITFFKQTRSDIIQLENRMGKLERNVDLLCWNATIEYQMFEGVEYRYLNISEKIICLVSDFSTKTKCNWNTGDLMLLKSSFSGIGLPVNDSISLQEFFYGIFTQPLLIDKLLVCLNHSKLDKLDVQEIPLIYGMKKIRQLQGEEKYVAATLTKQISIYNKDFTIMDAQRSLLQNFLEEKAEINIQGKVLTFDLALELLWAIKAVVDINITKAPEIIVDTDITKTSNNIKENLTIKSIKLTDEEIISCTDFKNERFVEFPQYRTESNEEGAINLPGYVVGKEATTFRDFRFKNRHDYREMFTWLIADYTCYTIYMYIVFKDNTKELLTVNKKTGLYESDSIQEVKREKYPNCVRNGNGKNEEIKAIKKLLELKKLEQRRS